MSEHTSDGGRLRFGVPACVTSRDRVDQVLLEWDRERPDRDFAPVGVITRRGRARTYLDAELSATFARFVKLPPVEPKKVPEIVKFEAIQQIPFPLDDVEWSYQLFQAPDSPDVEVGILAMRKELVNRFIKDFTDFSRLAEAGAPRLIR